MASLPAMQTTEVEQEQEAAASAPVPQKLSLPRAVISALTDNSAPGEAWDVAQCIRELRRDGQLAHVPICIARLENALLPVDGKWLEDRLTIMWTAMGHSRDPRVSAAWLHETIRLLSDLPGDIAADAIDEAIKASERGYMPSVGAIRKIAEPMVAKRKRALARLRAVVTYTRTDPVEVKRPTPEQVAEILRENGFASILDAKAEREARVNRGPARNPTREDYLAMGVAEEHLSEAMRSGQQA